MLFLSIYPNNGHTGVLTNVGAGWMWYAGLNGAERFHSVPIVHVVRARVWGLCFWVYACRGILWEKVIVIRSMYVCVYGGFR